MLYHQFYRFKEKYHPDDSAKRFVDEQASIRWRADVFKQMVELEVFSEVDLDLSNENEIVKVLDSGELWVLFDTVKV